MKLFGLTGGVGMGKSTAAGFFSEMGVRVVDTDDIAHELVRPGQPALDEIKQEFGEHFLKADGTLNRSTLAKHVFADESARKKLEAILHPRIRAEWQARVESWRNENVALAIVVIPLLFETQAETCFDRIICVACSSASQRERLAARGWSETEIARRIAAQMPVDQKIARSQFVIWTEGQTGSSRRQITEIIGKH